jgi:hypothetical protein
MECQVAGGSPAAVGCHARMRRWLIVLLMCSGLTEAAPEMWCRLYPVSIALGTRPFSHGYYGLGNGLRTDWGYYTYDCQVDILAAAVGARLGCALLAAGIKLQEFYLVPEPETAGSGLQFGVYLREHPTVGRSVFRPLVGVGAEAAPFALPSVRVRACAEWPLGPLSPGVELTWRCYGRYRPVHTVSLRLVLGVGWWFHIPPPLRDAD